MQKKSVMCNSMISEENEEILLFNVCSWNTIKTLCSIYTMILSFIVLYDHFEEWNFFTTFVQLKKIIGEKVLYAIL